MTREKALEGRVALVTGAGSGIGRAAAAALVGAGAAAVLVGRREEFLHRAAEEIAVAGGRRPLVLPGDVRCEEEIGRIVRAAQEELGPIDILVNNAGVNVVAPLVAMPTGEWRKVLDTNLTGPFLLMRAVLPGMCERGRGVVVNVASVSALPGLPKLPGFSAYCASKYGLVGLTEAAHREVRAKGARCVVLLPGSTDTAMLRNTLPGAEPLLSPEEVARTILFICTDDGAPLAGGPVTLMP